ncbi:MAG TPA: hypothetical protein VKB52_09535 [Rhodanobacteraceae bacterium]|nr:hypothetical protein [Rhodanobacteraceae bacterium]
MIASRPAAERWPSYLLALLIASGTVLCIGELIVQLVGEGPFGWHLSRDRAWQGGLEVLALAALFALFAGLVKSPRWRAVLLIVLGLAYLRRHAVDLPMLVDVLYFEILIGLGAGAARLAGAERANDVPAYLRLAVAGLVLWSLGAWTLSAFGLGWLNALRYYTILLAVPAFAARQRPLSVFLWQRFASLEASSRAGVAALAAWFLCLAARTNLVSGFDAWWYGLRGDYMLVAGGSVFASLDLVAPVNYYPKLFELLLIPVSGLRDTSVIEGISLLVLVLFALTSMELLKAFRLGFRTRLLVTAVCITVPAIANASLTPKPDLFAAWLLLLACLDGERFAREGSRDALLWMLVAFALAFSSKLSAPPYIVAIGGTAIAVWYRNGRPRGADADRFTIAIAAAMLVVAALVTARTWLLAGVPVVGPQVLVDLFAKLGMPLKPPVGLLKGGPPVDWAGLPELLVDQLFRPQRLQHMVITWVGNVWLYLFALALAARLVVGKPSNATPRVPLVWIAALLVGFALLMTFRTVERGGDGNYFVLSIALAVLLGAFAALKRLPPGLPTRLLLAMLPLFVVFQAWYGFVSAGWATGTRAFDLDFARGVRDLRLQNERVFRANGIETVAEYLRAVPGIARGVGYVADGPAFRLAATFETLNFYGFWQRGTLASADTFIDYLAAHRIDYLVMPTRQVKLNPPPVATVVEAAQRLRETPGVRVIDDRNYALYDLSALHAAARETR